MSVYFYGCITIMGKRTFHEIAKGENVKQINKDKNIWIIGGNTILAPLLDHNMVDYIIIQIAPVLLGAGISLFTQKEAVKHFRLKEVKKYGQFAELVYEKK